MPKSPARVRVKGFSKAKALHGEGQLVSGGPTSPEIKKKSPRNRGLKIFLRLVFPEIDNDYMLLSSFFASAPVPARTAESPKR